MSHGTRGQLAWVRRGPRSGESTVLVIGFSVLVSIAPLIEHEWGSRQHPAHEGVKSPGNLFMTWRAQGVMNLGYLCSCSRCAATRHLEQ